MPPRKKTETEQAPEETPAVEPEQTNPETEQAPEDPTGGPVDLPHTATPVKPADPVPALRAFGATFAERKAAREAAESKQVTGASAENKAVQK